MSININDIRNSGLLELYVLGNLSPNDLALVEASLKKFPELKSDIQDIEKAFQAYANMHAIEAPKNLLDNVALPKNTKEAKTKPNTGLKVLTFASLLIGGILSYMYYTQANEAEQKIIDCEEDQETLETTNRELIAQNELYKKLFDPDFSTINVEATPGYASTQITLKNNAQQKENILIFENLPDLAQDQSFQLWSLKADTDPIPLDVFQNDLDVLEVAFEEGTSAYAITIEPKGGSQSPTLDRLIGVFNI